MNNQPQKATKPNEHALDAIVDRISWFLAVRKIRLEKEAQESTDTKTKKRPGRKEKPAATRGTESED